MSPESRIPAENVGDIAGDLSSKRGRGSYSMTLSHYEPAPPNVQQQIVAQYAKKKEEEEE